MLGSEGAEEQGYAAPRYHAPEGATWLHALHGNVPDHQIDFIYCPEAPQGAFTRTHLGHLARLMKYLEPRTGSPFAFAIGNLSRDDTQHEPGHGAVALMIGLRVVGETDSAGRQDPPLAHAIIATDRELSYRAFLEAAMALHGHLAGRADGCTPAAFYSKYARAMAERPEEVPALLEQHVHGLGDLPALETSTLAEDFCNFNGNGNESGEPGPRRIFVVHDEGEPFGGVAHAAAKLAAVLYRSSLRWTSIVFGGAADIPGGLSIELVTSPPLVLGPEDRVLRLEDMPEDEAAIAQELFGARPLPRRQAAAPAPRPLPDEDEPTRARPLGGVEIEVDLTDLAEEPKVAATPARAAAAQTAPRTQAPMAQAAPRTQARIAQAAPRTQARVAQAAPRAMDPAPREDARGSRWARAGVLGAGLVLAGGALLAARGWEEPAAAGETRAQSSEPGPASMGTPMVIDIDRNREIPPEETTRATAKVPTNAPAGASKQPPRPWQGKPAVKPAVKDEAPRPPGGPPARMDWAQPPGGDARR